MGAILSSNDPYMIIISILWLLSNVALMIIVYHASVRWGPVDRNDVQLCVVDSDSGCFNENNRVWLFINVLFIVLLIIATLWAGELGNADAGPLRTVSGILILLGGLLLCALAGGNLFMYNIYIVPFWMSVGYLLIWFGLTVYAIITTPI